MFRPGTRVRLSTRGQLAYSIEQQNARQIGTVSWQRGVAALVRWDETAPAEILPPIYLEPISIQIETEILVEELLGLGLLEEQLFEGQRLVRLTDKGSEILHAPFFISHDRSQKHKSKQTNGGKNHV